MLTRLLAIIALLSAVNLRADDTIIFRIRLQPRLDFGDITRRPERSDYKSEADMYLRRVRLEIVGKPTDRILYIAAFSADRWNQKGRDDQVTLGYAFMDYRFSERLRLHLGLSKLPYSKSALTSSSRQLLIERPAVVDLGTRLFNYFVPHIMLHGKLAQGKLAYNFTVMDGLQAGDLDRAFSRKEVVESGDPGFVGRIEFSPAGWIEARKSESHLGRGRHLGLGLNSAFQSGIGLADIGEERRFLLGADLSFHLESISLQTEYMYMERDGTTRIEPSGWYVQGGYYIKRFRLEPAARFGRVDGDRNRDDDQTRIFSGGVNCYLRGHDLKIQANIFRQSFDKNAREVANRDAKTGFRLQGQMYF